MSAGQILKACPSKEKHTQIIDIETEEISRSGDKLWKDDLVGFIASSHFRGTSQVALVVKNLPDHARDAGLNPEVGRSPGGGNGKLLQHFCLKNSKDKRSLAGYSPRSCKESETAEQLSTHTRG